MSVIDTILLVVSMAVVVGISSLLPWSAWQDYKFEKKRNESLQRLNKEVVDGWTENANDKRDN